MTNVESFDEGFSERFYTSLNAKGFHRLHYTLWGGQEPPQAPPLSSASSSRRPLVCVHGLTRCGRDFDTLAKTFAKKTVVACPDVVGRGKSDWLNDSALYHYPQYLTDIVMLFNHLGTEEVDFIGTSMGGVVGMMLASLPRSPIRRLVINDVGTFVPYGALKRIKDYLDLHPVFSSFEKAETYMRTVLAPFGKLEDGQWQSLTRHSILLQEDGSYVRRLDPAIAHAFQIQEGQDVQFPPYLKDISCPVLLIRGQDSELLLPQTVLEMKAQKPDLTVLEIPGTGHAPSLMVPEQIDLIQNWFETTEPGISEDIRK